MGNNSMKQDTTTIYKSESQMTLAVIGKIIELNLIKDADRIMHAVVVCGAAGKWSGVVGLTHRVGELVTVFLQDAILPPNERWAFMEKFNHRVRMARFKGVASECVIVPGAPDLPVGTNLTEALGVTKHSKPLPASMTGDAVGNFPTFIPKTDEPNFQTVPELVERMGSDAWVATLKCDGSSCTAWNDEAGNLHVASRNLELREFNATGAGNSYWRAARKYNLSQLPLGMALQFEIVGPGIQSNPMGLTDVEGRAFTLYDYSSRQRESHAMLSLVCANVGMPMAGLVLAGNHAMDSDSLRKMAEVKYPSGMHGEGVVIRCRESGWSFKVINLLYKD
jgi:RNA ligase (TIGR02306 family)